MRTKTPFEDQLLALLEPVATGMGFEIVRLRLTGSKRPVLQIFAEDAQGRMTVDNCARLSRAFSSALEEHDPITHEYVLEVSSPGLDRPLVSLKDFETYTGSWIKLSLDRLVEGKKRFRGQIEGIEGSTVLIALDGEDDQVAELPFGWITEAKLVITDEMLKSAPQVDIDPETQTVNTTTGESL